MKFQELFEKNKPYLMSGAFWVSPRGKFLDAGRDLHIGMVIKQPETFGLTRRYIDQLHEKYGEQVGQEGDAREEIMLDLMKQGWIRIRRYQNHYSIQTWSNNFRSLNNIEDAVKHLINNGVGGRYASPNDEFKITTQNSRPRSSYGDDILSGGLHA